MEFQEVMRDRFVAVIEDATGRQVVGFMSGNQQDPDMICEVFVLAPTELVDRREFPGAEADGGLSGRGDGFARFPGGCAEMAVRWRDTEGIRADVWARDGLRQRRLTSLFR